jgi:hypothetical protein
VGVVAVVMGRSHPLQSVMPHGEVLSEEESGDIMISPGAKDWTTMYGKRGQL